MSFSRPIQWYHSYVDTIWLDGTFKNIVMHFYIGPGNMYVRVNIL
jgi:hypothetical protein